MMGRVAAIVLMLFVLTGCNEMDAKDFAEREPRLQIEDYFAGRSRGWGVFEDRFGSIRREFVVEMEGTWDGSTLVLNEDFTFADGATSQRTWRIRKVDDHYYEGHADDIVGTAKGVAYGNAFNFRYTLMLPVGDRTWELDFDDWMLLQPGGVVINRARVRKWGVRVGSMSAAFLPLDHLKNEAADATPATSAQ